MNSRLRSLAAALVLIMLIGGRVIPSFTRNWLARRGQGRLPVPFCRLDVVVMVTSGLTLASWIILPEHRATAVLSLCSGLLNCIRLGRWAGERTWPEPLVFILHVAYAFVPIGFVLLALSILTTGIVAQSGALHGWTTGAVGLMTLAVMTRASLGHVGLPLTASRPILFIYIAAIVAALARIVVAFGELRQPMLHLSAIAWVLAFGGFVAVYSPLLMKSSRKI